MKKGWLLGLAVSAVAGLIWAGMIGTAVNASDPPAFSSEFCRVCHTGGPDGSMADEHHVLVVTKNFTCFYCHQWQLINGVIQITLNRDCLACHGPGGIGGGHGTTCDTAGEVHNALSSAAACTSCHATSGFSNICATHNSDCALCHASTKSSVVNTIRLGRAGTAVNCLNCHDGSANGAGGHGTTCDTAGAVHDKLSSAAACTSCHNTATFAGICTTHNSDCALCHASTKSSVVNTIRLGRAGTAVNCLNCHDGSANGAGGHGTTCDTAGAVHDKLSTDPACASCHNTATFAGICATHNSDCALCHASTRSSVVATIAAGRAGRAVNCLNCHDGSSGGAGGHGTTCDTAGTVHDKLSAAAACAACHHVANFAEICTTHKSNCAVCHANTKPDVVKTIRDGRNGIAVDCWSCHTGSDTGAASHTSASHPLHLTDANGPKAWCDACHDLARVPLFADGQDLAHTTACDGCHSRDGAPLAKQYWKKPGSSKGTAGSWLAVEGEASFCGSCHDATPGHTKANGSGNAAFDVMGDKSAYGFYVTGHGKAAGNYGRLSFQDNAATGNPAANKGCGACHDLASGHFANQGKRLLAGFENDQANTNCSQCHADGRGATHDPQFYTNSTDYEKSAHSAKLCTECHNVHGSSGNYPAMTLKDKQALCADCHNNGGHPGVGTAAFSVDSKNYTLQCVSCHNVHVVTGTFSQASQDKTPVTKITDITNAWGDSAGEKMKAYAGSGTYRTPNGGYSASADKLPDYASFCLGCHNQPGNPPFGLDWNNDPHGHNSANQPDGYGTCPNWFACGKAFGWDGDDCKADQAEFPSKCWPAIPRGAGDQLFSREPYTHTERVAGANFTLSCTDCHTGHGSGTLSRAKINGVGSFTNWNNTCNYCHYYYSDWHAGMACGNASCHEVNSIHRMKKNHGSGGTRTFNPDLVLHYAFENNLKDSGTWQMDGKWYSTAGLYASGKVGQAGVFGEKVGAQVGTENDKWSTDEGYHGTWKYTEMKYNTSLEAWVNPTDSAKDEYTIFTKHTGYSQGGYRLSLKKISGTLRVAFNCQIDNNGAEQGGAAGVRGAYSAVAIPLNAWTHVAVSFDTAGADRNPADPSVGRIRIYVNGRDMTTSDGSGNNMQPGAGETSIFAYSENSPWNESICYDGQWCASEFAIGGFDWEPTNFIGMIDEAKVWNVTKNAAYFSAYQSQAVPYISDVAGMIGSNKLTVQFSEGVWGSGKAALTAAAFTLTDTTGNNPRTISGVAHTAGAATAVVTMSAPLTAADVDSDTLAAAAGAIINSSNRAASTRTVKIGLSVQCPTSPVDISLNEPTGSSFVMDSQGILYGSVTGSATLTGSAFSGGGDGSGRYIDFPYNTTCLQADRKMTIETRIRPAGLAGTDSYIRRVLARDGTGNYQISVWRNNSVTDQDPPADVAMIALWTNPVDSHGGDAWKVTLTDFNACPIVSDHWYLVKAVWNSDIASGIPARIYVDDQGSDGQESGQKWAGYIDCTDSDQSQIPAAKRLAPNDVITKADGGFTIGANMGNHANNLFNGLIDWITWRDGVN